MPDDFQITNLAVREGVVLLRITGRIDTHNASQLLRQCVTAHQAGSHVVLNLSQVTFIASSGIGALLALTEQFRQGPTRIRFTALSSAVSSVIELLNLDQFLAIDASEDQSLGSLAQDAA
jgi:anti-anti-sigma factor